MIQNLSTRLQTNEVNTTRDVTHYSSQTEAVAAANLAFLSIDSLQSTVAFQTNQINDLKAMYEAQGLQLCSEICAQQERLTTLEKLFHEQAAVISSLTTS